jgi:ABC-2 type transport system permease protein
MAAPVLTLFKANLRNWLGAKGFAVAVAAALLPMVLTGAWVGTHQGDVAAQGLQFSTTQLVEGDNVTLLATIVNKGGSAVGPFNATLSVGQVVGNTLRADTTNVTTIERLAPGASQQIALTWTARPGVHWALAYADSGDDLGEVEEFNNQEPKPFVVQHKVPAQDQAPRAPGNLTGDPNATSQADLVVSDLVWDEASLRRGTPVTVTATITNNGPEEVKNATGVVRVGRAFGASFFPQRDTTQPLDLPPGGSTTISVVWDAQEGAYWAEAYVSAPREGPNAVLDPAGDNNREARAIVVQPFLASDAAPPAPPEKATIKDFYLQILSLLHLRLLVPLIALFYAAGVLADEKEQGNLVYLLTRPVDRWALPVAKFLAGYVVAAAAVVVGIVGTFVLLFGLTPSGDIGFLTTPLLASLVGLFVYGTLFTLLGVLVDRPYLIGLAFVLGWETIAGLFVPFVERFTLNHYLFQAIQNWRLDAGVQPLPSTPEAIGALQLILLASLIFLALSATVMRRREFDV